MSGVIKFFVGLFVVLSLILLFASVMFVTEQIVLPAVMLYFVLLALLTRTYETTKK